MLTTEELNGGFTIGAWEVLPAKGLLRCDGEEIHPEPRVLAVLLALAKRNGDLATKDELIEEVWAGKAFSDEPLLRCISLLRSHFGDKKPFQYIETLQRRGYRLLQPISLHTEDGEPVAPVSPGFRRSRAAAALIAAGILATVGYLWLQNITEPEPRSLAILQIANLSGDPANQYIVDGIKNTLAPRLSEIPNFTIKNARLPYAGEEVSSIARRFKVESVLTGHVQLQDNRLRISYQISRGDNGATVGGGEVIGKIEDLFMLQEQLAEKIRDDLDGGASPQLITRREPDSAAYKSYMLGIYALELRFDGDNLESAIELLNESIRQDENYGPAYLALATAYALAHDYYAAPFDEMRELAIATIEKGVLVDPSIKEAAWAIHGFVFHQEGEWQKSERAYQRAIRARVVDSNAFSWYSRMLASTGRLEAALDVVLEAEALDPDNALVNSRIAMAETWLGNSTAAHEYFDRAARLGATGNLHLMTQALLLHRDGQAAESQDRTLAAAGHSGAPIYWVDPVYAALADPRKKDAALSAIDQVWAERRIIPDIVLIVRSLLGDIDGAMEIAKLLEGKGEAFSTEMLFVPETAPLRRHPDFLPLLERLGIVVYWDELGCRWDGDRVHCPEN